MPYTSWAPKQTVYHQKYLQPWPGGSVGWSLVPYTQRLQVPYPVGAGTGGNLSMFLSHIDVSFSLFSLSLSLCLSLNSTNISLGAWVRIEKNYLH